MPNEHDRHAPSKRPLDASTPQSRGPQADNAPAALNDQEQPSPAHCWETDMERTRLEINVLVCRCSHCGCLQIKNGEKPIVYKPNRPNWSPFRTLPDEPPCEPASGVERPAAKRPASALAGK